MINIIVNSDGLVFEGVKKINTPLNSVILLLEKVSDIVMFKSSIDYDTIIQEKWQNITINGEPVTKENIVDKFNEIANVPQGGGTKINAGTNITLQPEADGSITISATGELGATVAWNDVTDKPETFTPSAHNHVVADITDLQGKLDEKANVSDIPSLDGYATEEWVNSQGYLTEHQDISQLATKDELETKQDILVSGTNIKTINGQDILGEGNIEIQGGGSGISDAPSDNKLYGRKNANWSEIIIPSTDNFATKSEIADMLTKTEAASTYQPKGEYLTSIPDEYVTETELSGKGYATTAQLDAKLDTSTYTEDKATFATKEELARKANSSDLSNYLTTSVAESTYAKESSLEELKTSKLDVSTYNQDKETFALKTEIPNDYLTDADLTDYLTKDEASDTYRQKKIINFNRTNRSTEITNAWANSLNNIGATFQYVSFDEGATYNNVLYCGYRSYDGAGNRKGVGITEIDGKMRSVIFEFSGIDCVATLEDEIDLSDYATTAQLANKVDVSAYTEDKATFALKSELTNLATKDELNLKANSSDLSNYLQTSVAESTYAKKSEIPEEYTLPIATADVLGGIKVGAGLSINPETGVLSANGGGTADAVDWANITSKPETFKPEAHQHVTADVTDLQDKLDAKADTTAIADMATKTWVGEQGYLTEHQDISQLATKQEVTEGLATKQDKGNYLTVENAQSTYQPIGDYATKTELGNKVDTSAYTEDKATFALKSEISDMLTKTEASSTYQPKGEYLTAVPDEYVTETELSGKGYLTSIPEEYVTDEELTSALSSKQDKGNYLTVETADGKYQVKGDYATKAELANKVDTSAYTEDKATFALKSELTDFITVSVDNLVNYYKKSETYTKGEVDGKISAITTINFEVVGELPRTGESNKIYLVPNAEQGEQNVKDEYIWVDGKWEIIGSTKVDLSNYYNKGEVDSKLSAKVDLSTYTSDKETFALKSEISDMATQTWVTSQGYLTSHQDISNLATKQEVTEGLAGKQDKGDYALKSELPDISNLATKDELNLKANTSDLSNYVTTVNAEATYAKKSEIPSLEGYLQTSVADSTYATKTELEGKVNNADISDMLTKTEAASTYQPKGEYATKEEIGNTFVNASITSAIRTAHIDFTKQNGETLQVDLPFATSFKSGILSASNFSKLNEAVSQDDFNSALASKQDKLVSGESIKTINGQTLLGSGDITIEAGTSGVTKEYVDEQLALKADKTSVPTVQTGSSGNENNYIYAEDGVSSNKNVVSRITVSNNDTYVNIKYYQWGNTSNSHQLFINGVTTDKAGVMLPSDKIKLDSINTEEILTKTEASSTYKTIASEWYGTQSEYDLITEKDPNVTYYITEG